jgi:hypothetical protein
MMGVYGAEKSGRIVSREREKENENQANASPFHDHWSFQSLRL